jgi:hypothetical protein
MYNPFWKKALFPVEKTKFLLSDFQVFGLRLCIKSFGEVAKLHVTLAKLNCAFLATAKVNNYKFSKVTVVSRSWFHPVLRIHAILVWIRIRIRGSIPLTNGSGSFFFIIDLQDANKKLPVVKKSFSAHYFLKVLLHHFSKKSKSKRSHKTVEIKVFLTIFA